MSIDLESKEALLMAIVCKLFAENNLKSVSLTEFEVETIIDSPTCLAVELGVNELGEDTIVVSEIADENHHNYENPPILN